MNRNAAFWLALWVMTNCVASPAPISSEPYESLGPLETPFNVDPTQTEQRINAFIWNHWQQRLPAHVTATFYSKEGERSITEADLGQDVSGRWRVAVTITRQRSGASNFIAYIVEKTSDSPLRLVMKDANGQKITQW